MKVSQLKKLLSKVPDDLDVEIHLDMLDDEEPILGAVKTVSIALSVDDDKGNVLVIEAEDASPEDEEDDEEEGEGDEDGEGDGEE